MADIEEQDLSSVSPKDYLRKGFLDNDGELREGINGYYSLAMAYHLRNEKVQPDLLKGIVDQMEQVATQHGKDLDNPNESLSSGERTALQKIFEARDISGSPTLAALAQAATPWVRDWKNYGALLVHIERIMTQLALVTAGQRPA